jgi:hypothetical protein
MNLQAVDRRAPGVGILMEETLTGGQAVQQGLAELFIGLVNIGLNLIVLIFQATLTDVFSHIFGLFQAGQ